jgi:hypothetical protein
MFTEGVDIVCVRVETAGNDAIGDEGVIRIAEGLEKNTSLKQIILERVFLNFIPCLHCFISHSLLSAESVLFDMNDELTLHRICVTSVINVE